MKNIRRSLTLIFTLFICFVFVPVALAHPLGNFTINQYVGLQIGRNAVVVDYVVDMAEIPAFQEIALIDANRNGQPDFAEVAGYHADKCSSLRPGLRLLINNQPQPLSLTSSSVEFPAGVGGLSTLRLTCVFRVPLDAEADNPGLSFHNNAFPDRLGWTEVVVIPDRVILKGDYSSTSLSNRLTEYPQDFLSSPLDQRGVELVISSVGLPGQNQSAIRVAGGTSPLSARDDAFTRLIQMEKITFPALLLALAAAFTWGAMHALTPGHGKTIVGAYLVGSRGTPKHALYLGLTTTITHTLGVFALGLVTLFAARYILPETLYPWMSLLSGVFVVGIGINLFRSRFKSSGIALPKVKANLARHTLSPVYQQTHAEDVEHSHKYVLNISHDEFHGRGHGHPHTHFHGHAPHHIHGEGDRSHMPPEQITWRSLLALGISGGLLPCPSALVVLLGAIALNRIGFGIILVLAFSLGLAGALTTIGMLFIYAWRLFERFPAQSRVIRLLPVMSALFVSVIGAAIIWKALGELGIV